MKTWRMVHDSADVEELMRVTEHFHDCYMAGFKYDPLARAADNSKSLARFVSDTNSLVFCFRYDSTGSDGEWPEIELEFHGVHTMRFSNCGEPDPCYECFVEKTERGWVFSVDHQLTAEERNHPNETDAHSYVFADEICWRHVEGTLWADE